MCTHKEFDGPSESELFGSAQSQDCHVHTRGLTLRSSLEKGGRVFRDDLHRQVD